MPSYKRLHAEAAFMHTLALLFRVVIDYDFIKHPASEHKCDGKGCGHVLVIDGNMKNHRDVCLAREAGFVEFSGLPGKLKTGCPNTPQPKSRYCPSHAPTAFTPEGDSSFTDTAVQTASKLKHEEQLAFITAKKTTRQNTFYQVHNPM